MSLMQQRTNENIWKFCLFARMELLFVHMTQ